MADPLPVGAERLLPARGTDLGPGPRAPAGTLPDIAGLAAARLLGEGHALGVIHHPLRALPVKGHAVHGASLGAPATGSRAGSPLSRFPPAGHRINQKKVSPAKLPGGTEESVLHPYRNQTGIMSLCRIESEASSHLTKRAQLNWQCRALVPLQRHISSYKTLVSLEMQSSPRRRRSLSMGFGLLMSAKMLCLE